MGAFQGIARVDYLDLNDSDAGVLGGKQTAYQLGLTWIPVDYVRFLLNYSRLELKDAAIAINGDRDYGVDVVGLRAQIPFCSLHLLLDLPGRFLWRPPLFFHFPSAGWLVPGGGVF